MPADQPKAISATESRALFADLEDQPALVLAVSGGPDSTALMVLAARWRDALKVKPKLIAVTVDHGLRKDAKAEAAAVSRLARKLKVTHRILRWRGEKPSTGLQQAARAARYRLLAQAARDVGATHILTAHTLDDQAETVLIRMSRGSGITGLGAMVPEAKVPGAADLTLVRPLLDLPKARLVATLRAADIAFAEDPSNIDPRFTRARLRALMPRLAEEGLDARRLATLALRLRRADEAIEAVVRETKEFLTTSSTPHRLSLELGGFVILPDEITLRVLGRAITEMGTEGPVELGKLEALKAALGTAFTERKPFRRTLAGAIVTLAELELIVDSAPPRRQKSLTMAAKGRTKARAKDRKPR